MHQYRDSYTDRHDKTEIGSRNRIHLRDVDLSAFTLPVTIIVVVCVLLLGGAVGYLIIAQAVILTSLILAVVFGGFLMLVWQGIMICIRSLAATRAACSYYAAQNERNRLISPDHAQYAIFDDDQGRYRLEHGRDVKYEYTVDGSNMVYADQQNVPGSAPPDKLAAMISKARSSRL